MRLRPSRSRSAFESRSGQVSLVRFIPWVFLTKPNKSQETLRPNGSQTLSSHNNYHNIRLVEVRMNGVIVCFRVVYE